MIEETSPLIFILLMNSIFTIGLILNQNESTKDSTTKKNQSSSTNPFENITWICVISQLILLLIQGKINDS